MMKLDQCIFLSLILSAAMILGSTTCVAVNFPYIKQQADMVTSTMVSKQGPAETQQKTAASQASTPASAEAPTKLADNHAGSTDIMVMTSSEKAQLMSMLTTLGLTRESDMFAFIKEFQSKHALTPTGNIDSRTLSYIMEEARLQKATQQSS